MLFQKNMKRLAFIFVLFVTLLISVGVYGIIVRFFPFLTISSPEKTYTVNLTGQKQRPFFFNVEVHFNALKNGKPFVLNQLLHSGDAMDISFESGFPKYRWLSENILHFYEKEYSEANKLDTIIIVSKTTKVINYLKVFSKDKFIIFDISPISETKLFVSPPSGDFREIFVEGGYSDGLKFEKGGSFSINEKKNPPFTYYIHISDTDLTIVSS